MIYTQQEFERALEGICPTGFRKDPRIAIFTSTSSDVVKHIHVSYNDYSPHSVLVRGVTVHITFEQIEQIFASVLKDHNVMSDSFTMRKALQKEEGIDYEVFETEITDQHSFNKVAAELRKLINGPALAFFERFSSVEKVASFLAPKKAEEIGSVIPGAALFPKTALILREAKHSQYKERLQEFHRMLSQLSMKNDQYRVMSLVFNQLFSSDLKHQPVK